MTGYQQHKLLCAVAITGAKSMHIIAIIRYKKFFQQLLEFILISCSFQVNTQVIPIFYNQGTFSQQLIEVVVVVVVVPGLQLIRTYKVNKSVRE